ncbi:hypothetical protein WS89_04145 [Burkholderia sp. MSMB1072]|uniref:hypothetical protein n=1 Tax=Burkholderia sp. MSMB1072 TaxID=1637871 RepID=UPI000752CEC9|nr:hypothetical protein [Burkholderia sp. MSMB1072]KVH64482.1 hypothetical protein WS89_04145 [Burkholderia sp. MSMB1072]
MSESFVFWIDWGGWLLSNVVVGAFAPLLLLWVIKFGRAIVHSTTPTDTFAPFRDGQLGFVALGWAAGAEAEIFKWAASGHLAFWELWVGLLILIPAGVGALVAGLGSIATPHTPAPAASIWAWMRTYLAFTASVIACVVVLVMAAAVHYAAN